MAAQRRPLVGVLAIQGDVAEHVTALSQLGSGTRLVKLPQDLAGLDGLIIPGGESTAIGKLLRRFELLEPLREASRRDFPIYGTCAGMILLANQVSDGGVDQPLIGGMDIRVQRNAFGRQRESFEADLAISGMTGGPFHGVFIRAPMIEETAGGVTVLARLDDNAPVAARQGRRLVTAFHPELTADSRMHRYFLELIEGSEVEVSTACDGSAQEGAAA
ncbi:MAG TPA: pyridoxal 5'-phosphate synthase glutaminase subunit PdxT [Chloroflexota bacterium]|nr:pyridoxal 5'-phosphate synthase glutaminase subunit PdxT [Chloroflexota bacterium]